MRKIGKQVDLTHRGPTHEARNLLAKLKSVKVFYLIPTALLGLVLACTLLVGTCNPSAITDPTNFWSKFGLGLALLGLIIFSYRRLETRPFFWTVLIAVTCTLAFILETTYLVMGELAVLNKGTLSIIIIQALFIGAFWYAVALATRLHYLLELYPNLRISRTQVVKEGIITTITPDIEESHAEHKLNLSASQDRRQGLLLTVICTAIIALLLFLFADPEKGLNKITLALVKPTLLPELPGQFAATWNGPGSTSQIIEKLTRLSLPPDRDLMGDAFFLLFGRFPDKHPHPRLGQPDNKTNGDKTAQSKFKLLGLKRPEPLVVDWKFEGGTWWIQGLSWTKDFSARIKR